MNICDVKKCSGCLACYNICPYNAVDIVEDALGKTLCNMNMDKCVKCGLCTKVCPVNNPVEFREPIKAFAAWSKTDKDIKLSSSGGVASVFAREIIRDNGVVFGATVKDKIAKQIVIEKEEDIELLRGSKYVQSDVGYTFREVKEMLKVGKKVLYIGTPCQIAGLQSYLMKDYENLVTVDLICHGTPPMKYLSEYLNEVCGKDNWESFSFRGKHDYMMTAYSDKIAYQKASREDVYFTAFSLNLTFRDNCYSCPYSQGQRVSDITIGDFWGINRNTLQNQYKGKISVILTNTHKGETFFDEYKDLFIYEERKVEEARNKAQSNLIEPSPHHPDRKIFEENLSMGFAYAVNSTGISDEIANHIRNKKIKSTVIYKALKKLKKILLKK